MSPVRVLVRARRARTAAVLGLLTLIGLIAGACTDGPRGILDAAGPQRHREADGAHHGHHAPVGPPAGAPAPARHTGPQGRVGQIAVECGYSHSAFDDPIVHPGHPGRSHRHDFFGNTTTDAHSTLATLLEGDTTCQKRMDTAAYWAPSLLDHGEPVVPSGSIAYYRAAPGVDPTELENYPPDLRIVAGDMTATEPQSTDLVGWACGLSSRHHAEPPTCPASAPLRAVITFPDCWDGVRTDSPDHRSHMANSEAGVCPATHPVHVPQLTFVVAYPISGEGHDLSLASGPPITLHADFVNAWDHEGLGREIELCLHRDVVCGVSSNRGEEPLFAT